MKVAVVGSHERESDSPNTNGNNPSKTLLGTREQFQAACEVIGTKLAEWGHRLIVPHSDHSHTAEYFALNGFKSVESAKFRHFNCVFRPGDPVLKAHFDAVEMSDAVILIGGGNGTYASGLGALRRRKIIIPITVFGGSARDLCEIPEIGRQARDEFRNLELEKDDWKDILSKALGSVLNEYPRVLIIHGRGDSGRELLDKIIEESNIKGSKLEGVATPVIMNLMGKGALSIPNVFEELASQVSAAIAIVTADDVGGFARMDRMGKNGVNDKEDKVFSALELQLKPRARENVWVEVGWFWGRLGRHRVFLWLKEELDLPSDLQGAAWTPADNIDEAWESIKAFMVQLRDPDGYLKKIDELTKKE